MNFDTDERVTAALTEFRREIWAIHEDYTSGGRGTTRFMEILTINDPWEAAAEALQKPGPVALRHLKPYFDRAEAAAVRLVAVLIGDNDST